LKAALDGIDRQLTPPAPLNNVNVYEMDAAERHERGVAELPGSLRQALEELEKDEVIQSAFSPSLYEAFMRAKWVEWDEFRTQVSDWEIERFLETA
jgi:glutamine synthetase